MLPPGQPGGLHHRELDNEEDFLVLAGECLALVEGEERPLRRLELALRHGCGAAEETTVPAEAYADRPDWEPGVPFEL